MATFASEKRAKGICERCGCTAPLRELRDETYGGVKRNVRVCGSCWDQDNPQLSLNKVRIVDPEGLRNPRPDTHGGGDRGLCGWNPVGNPGNDVGFAIGRVTVTCTED